jgi:hypothetical protein
MITFERQLAGEFARQVVNGYVINPVAARIFYLKET